MKPVKEKECNSCPVWAALKQMIVARELMANPKTQRVRCRKIDLGCIHLN